MINSGVTNGENGPTIKVGLVSAPKIDLSLSGEYRTLDGQKIIAGDYSASSQGLSIKLDGIKSASGSALKLIPLDFDNCRATIHEVTIGVDFHWQRKESQQFRGVVSLLPEADRVQVVNELPLENYLVSVISSEMSASCPPALLRAHAVVSRSWLIAQIQNRTKAGYETTSAGFASGAATDEILKWYDRENHIDFDVCADDHCQRYQGISKAFSVAAFEAVRATHGEVLTYSSNVCDTRYSKSCGGMTEEFRTAWADVEVPYLPSIYDSDSVSPSLQLPLVDESNAAAWIESSPPAFCNTQSKELLAKILPSFDQETLDFYRWRVEYSQVELSEIIAMRLGVSLGRIAELLPLSRGKSGRITRLKIVGELGSRIVGKELEIRRTLSRSHLYSSAFVVHTQQSSNDAYPNRFTLTGAGWGHGVGLCQIGAAVMAEKGYEYGEILKHYFAGAELESAYESSRP